MNYNVPCNNTIASYEIGTFIRFLQAKNMGVAEIHRELCAVYGKNVMTVV
jgi:hypothetical protein